MYSQNEEEKYILKAVGYKTDGRFLDIGAYDGKTFSNTLALIERGWEGVMVEPGLHAFESLLARHGRNQRLALVHAAVGYGDRLAAFWDSFEPYGTTHVPNVRKWKHLAHFSHGYLTSLITLEELFKQFPEPIDVLSIDTEGTSVDLFLHFPLPLFLPAVLCVEHDGRVDECLEHAGRYGYKLVYQSAENLVLVR